MSVIKKSMVLLLLATYLLIAVACIFYLPKYNPLRLLNNYKKVNTHLLFNPTKHKEHSGANVLVLLNRTYRSTIENKRGALDNLPQAVTVLVLLITGGISLAGLVRMTGGYLMPFRSRQYAYLSYCTLRI